MTTYIDKVYILDCPTEIWVDYQLVKKKHLQRTVTIINHPFDGDEFSIEKRRKFGCDITRYMSDLDLANVLDLDGISVTSWHFAK